MSKIKRTIAVACAVMLGALGVAVIQTPAQAAYSDCPTVLNGTTPIVGCFFQNADGGGSMWMIDRSLGCHNLTGGWNDLASSVKNHNGSGRLLRYWENANCSGASQEVVPNVQRNMTWIWNDEISSYAVYLCSDPNILSC